MSDFYAFAGEHPILTYLLFLIVFGSIRTVIRGYPTAPAASPKEDDK